MPVRYHLVYDIAEERLPHPAYLVVATLLLVTGLLSLVYRSRRNQRTHLGFLLIASALIFVAITTVKPWWEVWHLKQRMRTQGLLVEGRITDHRAEPTLHGLFEQFRVDSVPFRFLRGPNVTGFRNGEKPPVDLRDGTPARIHYLYELDKDTLPRILRLELAHDH